MNGIPLQFLRPFHASITVLSHNPDRRYSEILGSLLYFKLKYCFNIGLFCAPRWITEMGDTVEVRSCPWGMKNVTVGDTSCILSRTQRCIKTLPYHKHVDIKHQTQLYSKRCVNRMRTLPR